MGERLTPEELEYQQALIAALRKPPSQELLAQQAKAARARALQFESKALQLEAELRRERAATAARVAPLLSARAAKAELEAWRRSVLARDIIARRRKGEGLDAIARGVTAKMKRVASSLRSRWPEPTEEQLAELKWLQRGISSRVVKRVLKENTR